MVETMYPALFGNKVAEKCILYIVNYGEGHIRGIASTFDIHPRSVQLQLEKLESDGILVNRMVGNTKVFKINPRLPIKAELIALAEKILSLVPQDETDQYFRERRRPRRTGKNL
jgi:hypothetical protein